MSTDQHDENPENTIMQQLQGISAAGMEILRKENMLDDATKLQKATLEELKEIGLNLGDRKAVKEAFPLPTPVDAEEGEEDDEQDNILYVQQLDENNNDTMLRYLIKGNDAEQSKALGFFGDKRIFVPKTTAGNDCDVKATRKMWSTPAFRLSADSGQYPRRFRNSKGKNVTLITAVQVLNLVAEVNPLNQNELLLDGNPLYDRMSKEDRDLLTWRVAFELVQREKGQPVPQNESVFLIDIGTLVRQLPARQYPWDDYEGDMEGSYERKDEYYYRAEGMRYRRRTSAKSTVSQMVTTAPAAQAQVRVNQTGSSPPPPLMNTGAPTDLLPGIAFHYSGKDADWVQPRLEVFAKLLADNGIQHVYIQALRSTSDREERQIEAAKNYRIQVLILSANGVADPFMMKVRKVLTAEQMVRLVYLHPASLQLYLPQLKHVVHEFLPPFPAGEKPKAITQAANPGEVWQEVIDRLAEEVMAMQA